MHDTNKNSEPISGIELIFLGQAGFLIKGPGISIAIDPYLSNCVEREVGFKRMQPAIVAPEDLMFDLLLSTGNSKRPLFI